MESLERMERKSELLAFQNQMGASEYRIDELRAFKIGHAVADNDPLVSVTWETADDRRLAHAAVGFAITLTRMRPRNLDLLAAEVTAVAVNMILGDTEWCEERVDEEVNSAACHVKFDIVIF